jgi:hypothetical protein
LRLAILTVLRAVGKASAVTGLTLALLLPAQAQFWSDWGRPRPQPRYQPQQQYYKPFGDWFRGPSRPPPPKREAPVDNSHAPSIRKADVKDEAQITTKIVVMGDGMADWLAYGLEDAFSEQPEIGIVRKYRTNSGLIHYDSRRDTEWSQVAKDIIAAEKPKFVVMMVGVNDRQSIHEHAPAPAARSASKRNVEQDTAEALDPEALARQSADAQNAEIEAKAEAAAAKEKREQQAKARTTSGTFEFHSEQWESAYVKRIDATIAALRSAGVPVLWVGLPAQRNSRISSDNAYLNDLYRQRAEKAGIVYVDIWDGFVSEGGRYTVQGPDYEGQIRRLRSGDGVYFTKAGARKLAHYVEREIQRSLTNRAVPVALPVDPTVQSPGNRPGGPASRPMAGPVVPLTVSTGGGNELLGGGRAQRLPSPDPIATRVLTKGEPIPASTGRADDFTWPRGSNAAAAAEPAPTSTTAAPAGAIQPNTASSMTESPAQRATPAHPAAAPGRRPAKAIAQDAETRNDERPQPRKKAARRPPQDSAPRPQHSVPRPPMSIGPSTWFR